MRFPHYENVGERMKERLLALGYVTAEGTPHIARFIREYRYDSRYFYRWANKGATPAGENLERLAQDLGVTRAWLLFGDEGTPKRRRRHMLASAILALTIGGVLGQAAPSLGYASADALRLIGARRRPRRGQIAPHLDTRSLLSAA